MMLRFLTKYFNKKKSKREKTVDYTLIGKSTIITGDISSEKDDFRIKGTINGEISTKQKVFVINEASVKGSLFANEIINFGNIKAKIISKNLELKNSSRTLGTIKTKQLAIEEGALINGKIETTD